MKKIAFVVLSLLISQATFAETKEFDLKGITKVEINNTSGNVKVKGVESGKVTVVADKKKFGESCTLTMNKTGEVLLIDVKKSGFFGADCHVDFDIQAPKSAALDVESGSGDLSVTGMQGDLVFVLGSGIVNVDAVVKKLNGKIGSGNITINGLTAGGQLTAGSGNIAISYNLPPQNGELDIKSGSGNTEIKMPRNSKLHASFFAGSGQLTNEVGDTPQSPFKISMKTGSGNLHIKKL